MKRLAQTALAFALLWFAPHVLAAATIASITHSPTGGSATTITFTGITVTTGQVVVVSLSSRDNSGANYSSSTWNGSNQPANESANDVLTDGIQFHRLVFRGLTGTANLVVTLSATQDYLEGWAMVVNDAHATTVLGAADMDSVTESGLFGSSSSTVSATTNDLVITTIRVRGDASASLAEGAGQTELDGPQLDTGNGNTLSISSKPGAASVTSTYTWTDGSNFWAWASETFVIQGAAGAASSALPKILQQH